MNHFNMITNNYYIVYMPSDGVNEPIDFDRKHVNAGVMTYLIWLY